MKSPLRKRLLRELKSEFGKYLVAFIMMAITIGLVSGFLVADGSMLRAYDDSFQKYNIEDGYFQTKKKLTPAQKEDIEKSDVKVYENFYIEQKLTNGSTIRFFKNRKEVDKVCLMNGKMPKKSGEIAVDRMYADNNELKVGDTVKSRKKTFRITGLVALSDYSALFQNNNDTMFDAVKFGVAIVTDKDFEALNQVKVQYNYAWIYDKKPATEKKEKKMAEDLMEDMVDVVTIESFVPQYQNQSIHFTGDDMGSDRAMIVMLLYIVMAILAFVFGITISNTIRKEAGVIGTLRASGYTRRELILHYMALPVVITPAVFNFHGVTFNNGSGPAFFSASSSLFSSMISGITRIPASLSPFFTAVFVCLVAIMISSTLFTSYNRSTSTWNNPSTSANSSILPSFTTDECIFSFCVILRRRSAPSSS